jgi:PEGA domain
LNLLAERIGVTPEAVVAAPTMQAATVIVKSTPAGADINVDGKFMGNTPSTIQLTPGDHVVSVEKEGLRPWERGMTITAGGNITIDATLDKP